MLTTKEWLKFVILLEFHKSKITTTIKIGIINKCSRRKNKDMKRSQNCKKKKENTWKISINS